MPATSSIGPNNATDLWHVKKIPPQQLEHLTGKPAELAVSWRCSIRPVKGETVLDLFGGSGSTLIGAEQTGRRAFLMELDPPYCDVIVDRYQRFHWQRRSAWNEPANRRFRSALARRTCDERRRSKPFGAVQHVVTVEIDVLRVQVAGQAW